ncbi:hypothetical protein [Kitasatospora cathayae]|uniref:Uncharacterized protein n=1 Tax=Kitasatospora cathayae TaxID=3004092 RepID=A0ABY7QGR6_9ACTN|nr:hypothetical protein [Kitasatospora sp. HUAS 3-15]WBP91948.1 hypothetical protein O1G21_39855 [Kitasatospora sp. HUAS 3-15]
MTSQLPRGLTSLIPTSPTPTAGQRAAAQLLQLDQALLPIPVIAAAAELIADRLEDPDQTTRDAAGAVLAHLHAALASAAPRPAENQPAEPELGRRRPPA